MFDLVNDISDISMETKRKHYLSLVKKWSRTALSLFYRYINYFLGIRVIF